MPASAAMLPPPCDEEVLTMTVGSYSEATKLANGSCVKSAPVHVGGHSWRVVFYPNAGGSPAPPGSCPSTS